MRAVLVEAPGLVRVTHRPTPAPAPGHVVVRVRAVGLCHIDALLARGLWPGRLPVVPGHEIAGEVTAPADTVVVDPYLPCGRCRWCDAGRPDRCAAAEVVGITRDGGAADYVVVPASNVHRTGGLDAAVAALGEPLARVVQGVEAAGPHAGESALVVGGGLAGLLWVQILLRRGLARVAVADTDPVRRARAAGLGADAVVGDVGTLLQRARDLEPDGFDLVVETTGMPACVERAVAAAAPGGRAVLAGATLPGLLAAVVPHRIAGAGVRVVGACRHGAPLEPALRLLQAGDVTAEGLVTHAVSLEEAVQALDLVGAPGVIGVQVQW